MLTCRYSWAFSKAKWKFGNKWSASSCSHRTHNMKEAERPNIIRAGCVGLFADRSGQKLSSSLIFEAEDFKLYLCLINTRLHSLDWNQLSETTLSVSCSFHNKSPRRIHSWSSSSRHWQQGSFLSLVRQMKADVRDTAGRNVSKWLIWKGRSPQ